MLSCWGADLTFLGSFMKKGIWMKDERRMRGRGRPSTTTNSPTGQHSFPHIVQNMLCSTCCTVMPCEEGEKVQVCAKVSQSN